MTLDECYHWCEKQLEQDRKMCGTLGQICGGFLSYACGVTCIGATVAYLPCFLGCIAEGALICDAAYLACQWIYAPARSGHCRRRCRTGWRPETKEPPPIKGIEWRWPKMDGGSGWR